MTKETKDDIKFTIILFILLCICCYIYSDFEFIK